MEDEEIEKGLNILNLLSNKTNINTRTHLPNQSQTDPLVANLILSFSFHTLMSYSFSIGTMQSITMLGIINEHINFQVTPGQPTSVSDDTDGVTLVGGGQDAVDLINQKEVHWGMLEDSLEDRLDKAGGLLSDSEKIDGDNKEGENEENKDRLMEESKVHQSKSQKRIKPVVLVGNLHGLRPPVHSVHGMNYVKSRGILLKL